MEAAGLAIGIIGLYSACRDGYLFYENVKSAEKSTLKFTRSLLIQKSRLWAWGFYWEISRHDPAITANEGSLELMHRNRKIGEYLLQNPAKITGVELALESIASLFSDKDVLKKYGVELRYPRGENMKNRDALPQPSRDQTKQIQRKAVFLRQRLTILRRCTWVLKDRDKVAELTRDLESYNNSLHFLCPDGALGPLKILSVTSLVAGQSGNKVGLALDRSLAEELSAQAGPMAKGTYDAMADLTSIRVLAERVSQPLNDTSRARLVNLRRDEFELHQNRFDANPMSCMAIWRGRNDMDRGFEAVVLIEFKSYLDDHGRPDQDTHDNVLKLGYLVTSKQAPTSLLSRFCYGLFKDSEHHRIGFVYKLPQNLGISISGARMVPDALIPRTPVSLAEVLRTFNAMSLNRRFSLAKELLEAVTAMHATGWIHKNIRPTSIIFFPRDQRPINRNDIEWQRVNLMGWGFSRHTQFVQQYAAPGPKRSAQPRLIKLDKYQHPDKQNDPSRVYEPTYDMYSLGLVLLEIGLWRDLDGYVGPAKTSHWSADDVHAYIVGQVVPHLKHCCGETYMAVVQTCLGVQSKESMRPNARMQQEEDCLRLVARLAACNV
ncbi:hypothetical protein EJ05DRAFT_287882 [Pseudovirgaria hyperparasitica]|uniref:Protein kinase domain-containing protein n=1 Tax=Pseudovirgaria hyperparasitica TaxID=470096 RepID=A0A6A6WFY4_9PEZI|nr:uncharacterized protein EJ05DRAFT_287882 [Pseudovirgaria hyperparasitica]KAF2760517.1 hypothetical protein EJ05DRAFT_287882 [Pseudovirgaria hyperparasitica]